MIVCPYERASQAGILALARKVGVPSRATSAASVSSPIRSAARRARASRRGDRGGARDGAGAGGHGVRPDRRASARVRHAAGMSTERMPVFDVQLDESVVEAVADTLRTGWLTLSPRTQEFEAEFAEHLGVPHAIAMSSCASALHLAYWPRGWAHGGRGDCARHHLRRDRRRRPLLRRRARARRDRRPGRPRDRS